MVVGGQNALQDIEAPQELKCPLPSPSQEGVQDTCLKLNRFTEQRLVVLFDHNENESYHFLVVFFNHVDDVIC